MNPTLQSVVHRSATELSPHPRNARTHSRKQTRQIATSIERFGFLNPVLIDDARTIIAGHGRVQAAAMLGMETVPCLLVETLSDAEKRAYMLADNRIAQNANWDDEILSDEIRFLVETPEIDITVTGFDVAHIDVLLEPRGSSDGDDPREDIVPVPSPSDAVSKTGDVWLLGEHRLLCGNALHPENYAALLSNGGSGCELARMVFTDPPYNVRIDGNAVGSGGVRHREFAMASGEMSRHSFTEFLDTSISNLVRFSVDGSIHFLCMDWRHLMEMQSAGERHYSELKNLIVWVKDNGGMGSFYRSRHELVFAWKNGTAPHLNAFELGQQGRYRTNVWNYRGVSSGGKQARDELAMHPTVKPVAMVADAMKDCSTRGSIVLDPFCGSGTVLIAAQKVAAAVARMMDVAARDFATAGAAVETLAGRQEFGPCVRARFGSGDPGQPGILVLGHLDTVHPVGTIKTLRWREDGERCYGPGVYDMKGGVYLALEAMRQLGRAGIRLALPVTFLLTSDEEVGSPANRGLIEAEAARSKYVLVPEPGGPASVVSGR